MELLDLEQAIQRFNVTEVKRLIEDRNCDVNGIISHIKNYGIQCIYGRPLSFSLQRIKSEKDEWFHISQMLLEHKNINVNASYQREGYMDKISTTILGHVCGTRCESTIGVRTLL